MYRIPKHVHTRSRFLGLDVRGFIIQGLNCMSVFLSMWFFPPHGANAIAPRLFLHLLQVGLPWIWLSQKEFVDEIQKSFYHAKHAQIQRWESGIHGSQEEKN